MQYWNWNNGNTGFKLLYDNADQAWADDKPCINTGGFTAISQKYNEKGMITEVAFWDIAEKPCLVNGYFMEKTEFDD